MIEAKDIMSPLMGASATVTGLTLVFLGIGVSARQEYDATTPSKVLRPFRIDGSIIFGAFIVGVLAVCAAGTWWASRGQAAGVFTIFLILAAVQVITTVCAAGRVLYRVW